MKNFLSIAVNIGVAVFALSGIFAFINYFAGTNIGLKGATIPGDPILGIVCFVLSGICLGLSYLFREKK